MHSYIVNGYQLLWHAHTVLEPHRETIFFSILLAIVLFLYIFLCVCHFWQSYFFSCVTLYFFVNNLKRTEDLVIPWHDLSVHTFGTQHLNDIVSIALKALLNLNLTENIKISIQYFIITLRLFQYIFII